jgi:stress-induced morphogen
LIVKLVNYISDGVHIDFYSLFLFLTINCYSKMTFTTIPPQAPSLISKQENGGRSRRLRRDRCESHFAVTVDSEEEKDQLYNQAASTPWLKSFLDNLACVVNAETKTILLDKQENGGRSRRLRRDRCESHFAVTVDSEEEKERIEVNATSPCT